MTLTHKLSSYKTTVATVSGVTSVIYHSTAVVSWDSDTITLRTGGWDSVTTRRKMNQTASQFGLAFNVFSRNFESFVTLGGSDPVPLVDGMRFSRRPYWTKGTDSEV